MTTTTPPLVELVETSPEKVRLRDLVLPVEGGGPDLASDNFTYIDLSSVDASNKRISSPRAVAISEAPSRARQRVLTNDVLVSTVRPNLNGVAIVPGALNDVIASTGFCVLRADAEFLDSRYLYHWVRSDRFVAEMVRRATGASYPAVSDSIVKDSEIPLPPLPEQRRIAALLDQADELRTKRRRAVNFLEETSDGLFLHMFGHIADNASDGLLEVCSARSGGTPSKERSDFWGGSVPWFSPKDLKSPDLWDSIDHVTEQAVSESTLTLFPAETVVLVVRGMILAHTLPVACLRVPATINQDMKALMPLSEMDPQFLAYAVRAQSKSILASVSAAGHGTKRLDTESLAQVRIPRVPTAVQRDFGKRVSLLRSAQVKQRAHLAKLDELFASLQHRAFSGQL